MKILLAFILGLIVLPIGGYLYFRFGYAPVATAASPMPFEKYLAHVAVNARIDKEAPKNTAIPANPENYAQGVRIYRMNCAVCHGLPNQEQTPTAKGMYPVPPHLFRGKGVTDDSPGETYWKVSNGIRLTGMPSYAKSLSTTEMWQVSVLLANADKLSPEIHQTLDQPLKLE